MINTPNNMDMKYWYLEWEKQQNALISMREERFDFMLDIMASRFSGRVRALDLGCGPGGFSRRFMQRFPEGAVTAIDYDPVQIKIFRDTYENDHVQILERDLRSDSWDSGLDMGTYNVAFSTTALHWLPEDKLKNAYEKIYRLLGRDGIFLDGDHFQSDSTPEKINEIYRFIKKRRQEEGLSSGAMDWNQWWNNLRKTGWETELFKLRDERFGTGGHDQDVPLEKHIEFLKNAGFSIIDFPWKYTNNMVLLAIA
jgi:SAM-dependent methyltransferase